jgi:50S ribosomal subunit-associated GTPase HflX
MKGGENTMQGYGNVQLRLANDRIRERIDEASRARLAVRDERPSLRRSVGHSMIRIGERLAAEPSPLRPAQLR